MMNQQTALEILEATHADVIVEAPNGQRWVLLNRMPKTQAVLAADAMFDLLNITSRNGDDAVKISLRYL